MDSSNITAAAEPVEIAGKTLDLYPLTDQELDTLTNWVRMKIKLQAREEAKHAETATEKSYIEGQAFQQCLTLNWFDSVAIQFLLGTIEGLCEITYRMTKKSVNREWIKNDHFGTETIYTETHLENRAKVQDAFLKLHTLRSEAPKQDDRKAKKK